MNTKLQVSVITLAFVFSFLFGYNISSESGNEPGYFQAPEAGAYGSVKKEDSPTGLSTDESDYYKSLLDK